MGHQLYGWQWSFIGSHPRARAVYLSNLSIKAASGLIADGLS